MIMIMLANDRTHATVDIRTLVSAVLGVKTRIVHLLSRHLSNYCIQKSEICTSKDSVCEGVKKREACCQCRVRSLVDRVVSS